MSDYQMRLFETLLLRILRELKELRRDIKASNDLRKDDGK